MFTEYIRDFKHDSDCVCLFMSKKKKKTQPAASISQKCGHIYNKSRLFLKKERQNYHPRITRLCRVIIFKNIQIGKVVFIVKQNWKGGQISPHEWILNFLEQMRLVA